MKEKPILFSGPMVRAILDGRKTQTRRVITNLTRDETRWRFGGKWAGIIYNTDDRVTAPDGAVASEYAAYRTGQSLWVREAFSGWHSNSGSPPRDWPETLVWYWADGDPDHGDWTKPKPGIHMPRWASRITLKVTDVRVQRLQDISEEDALAEGFIRLPATGRVVRQKGDQYFGRYWWKAVRAFKDLWEEINGPESWDANPWVYALTFEVEKAQNSAAGLKRPKADERPLPAEGAA